MRLRRACLRERTACVRTRRAWLRKRKGVVIGRAYLRHLKAKELSEPPLLAHGGGDRGRVGREGLRGATEVALAREQLLNITQETKRNGVGVCARQRAAAGGPQFRQLDRVPCRVFQLVYNTVKASRWKQGRRQEWIHPRQRLHSRGSSSRNTQGKFG